MVSRVGGAVIEIFPTFPGFQRAAKGEAGKLQGTFNESGRSSGGAFSNALRRAVTTGAAVAGGAAATGLGYALTRGFQRLTAIENAEAKLRGLGRTSGDVKVIMAGALEAVKGTSFGMDQAATAAAGAVAAGIKPGAELNGVLESMANSASAAGIRMDEMGGIYNKVASTGKAQNDVLQQVADRGIPIYKALADQLGVTQDQVFDMASQGKIDFAEFESAMKSASGTVATEMGKTTTGTLQNLDAALSRLGAGLLSGVFPQVQPLLASMIGVIDRLAEATGPLSAALGAQLGGAIGSLAGWLDRLDFTSLNGFLSSAAVNTSSLGLLGPIFNAIGAGVSWLGQNMGLVKAALPFILAGFAAWKVASMAANAVIQQQALLLAYSNTLRFASTMIDLQQARSTAVVTAAKNQKNLATIREAVTTNAATGATMRQTIATRLQTIATYAQAAAQRVLNLAMRAAPWVLLATAVAAAGFGLYKFFTSTDEGRAMWTKFTKDLLVAFQPLKAQFETMQPLIGRLMGTFAQLGGTILTGLVGALSQLLPVVLGVVTNLVSGLLPVVMQLATSLFPVLAQVIGAVIGVLAQILPIVVGLVTSLVSGLLPVVVQLATTIFPVLAQIIGAVVGAILPLITAILPVLVSLFQAVVPVISTIIGALMPLVTLLTTILVPVLRVVGAILGVVFQVAAVIIQVAVTLISGILTGLVWVITNLVVPYIRFLGQTWSLIFTAISTLVGLWWNFYVKPIFNAVVWFINTVLAPVFQWLYQNVILPVWNGIRAAIAAAWTFIKTYIFDPIVAFVRDVLAPRFELFKATITAVWSKVRADIAGAWSFIKTNVFDPIVAFLRDTLAPRFESFKTTATNVWSGIRTSISDAWNFIRDKVFSPLKDAITKSVPAAFEAGKDAIGKAWDKIKSVARKPVDFVVNTIINKGIIGTFNDVAGKFPGAPNLKPVKFRTGGAVSGPGTGTSDSIPAMLSNNEHVWTDREVRRAGGHGAMYKLRDLARRGLLKVGQFLPALAGGGTLMDAADWWVAKGAIPSRHSRWNGGRRITSGHSRGSKHYTDEAVDFNFAAGTSAFEQGKFDRYLPEFKRLFPKIRTIWRAPGHYNHLHIDTSNGADIGKSAGGGDGGGFDLLGMLNPFEKLKEKLTEGLKGQKAFGDLVAAGGKKLIGIPMDWIRKNITSVVDMGKEAAESVGDAVTKGRVKAVAARYGWAFGDQWNAIDWIVNKESSWNKNAANPTSSARGLFQKMTSVHGPLEKTVEGQAAWGLKYIKGRYGTPVKAMQFHKSRGYYAKGGPVVPQRPTLYDNGGWLQPGLTTVLNATKKPEAVFTGTQLAEMEAALAGGRRAGLTVEALYALDTDDAIRKLYQKDQQVEAHYAGQVGV